MDDFVIGNLQESRNDFCSRLINILTPHIHSGLKSIFEEAPEEHYNAYLLQILKFLYTGEVVEEMADVIELYGREITNLET